MTAVSFVSDDVLAQAKSFQRKNDLHEAIKALLIGIAVFNSDDQVCGVVYAPRRILKLNPLNCLQPNARKRGSDATQFLADMLKQLTGNPHMALKVVKGDEQSKIKKSYHKMALKYHPDKLKVRMLLIFSNYTSSSLFMIRLVVSYSR